MKAVIRSTAVILAFIILSLAGCRSNPALAPTEGTIEVTGGKVWYRIIGEGNETPLLLLHGGPGGTSWSFYTLAELSEDRPMILFDQLGSGRSYTDMDTSLMTLDSYVEQLKEFTTALGLNEFYLLGHSWGTTLGLAYYTGYPEGIEAMIFNSPCFSTQLWIRDADSLIGTLPDSIQVVIDDAIEKKEFDTPEFRQAERVYNRNFLLRGEVIFNAFDTAPAHMNTEIYETMWGPCEFIATGTLKDLDLVHMLDDIEVPTLFVTGEFDEASPSTVRYFQSLTPGSKFELIEGAGHATMHDNLPQNLQVIRDFLNELD